MNEDLDCPWLERVSASLDGEIPEVELEMVRVHAASCIGCRRLIHAAQVLGASHEVGRKSVVRSEAILVERSVLLRTFLGIFGALLLILAISNFLRGSSSHDDLHDVRHLAVWQASLGASVVILSLSFRLSLFVVATTTSFLVFTSVASVVDLVMGHRGPWADVTHLVEAGVVVLMLLITKPRARLSGKLRRQVISQRQA